jgi:hypothetical protein
MLYVASARSAEFINKNTAVVRIMDKASGRARTVNIPAESSADHEKISVLVRACKQTAPFEPENNFMFAEITKKQSGKIFSGWMDANAPGKNPLQDADYDLWLVRCE